MINTKESRAGVKACLEGMNELEKNMGNPLGDDLYEQHLKDVNNGIQLIIKAAVKWREDSMHNSSGGSWYVKAVLIARPFLVLDRVS